MVWPGLMARYIWWRTFDTGDIHWWRVGPGCIMVRADCAAGPRNLHNLHTMMHKIAQASASHGLRISGLSMFCWTECECEGKCSNVLGSLDNEAGSGLQCSRYYHNCVYCNPQLQHTDTQCGTLISQCVMCNVSLSITSHHTEHWVGYNVHTLPL